MASNRRVGVIEPSSPLPLRQRGDTGYLEEVQGRRESSFVSCPPEARALARGRRDELFEGRSVFIALAYRCG
jgi:hypothetical protein